MLNLKMNIPNIIEKHSNPDYVLETLDIDTLSSIEETTNNKENTSIETISNVKAPITATPELTLSPAPQAIGSVAITNSENVHFGPKTYFNGPVTIKQIVHSKSGFENGAFVKGDIILPNTKIPDNQPVINLHNKCILQKWQKITFLIALIFLVCVTIAFLVYGKASENGTSAADPPSVPGFSTTGGNGVPLIFAPDHLRIVNRTDWLAQPVSAPIDKFKLPVPWVIIAHTATESCYNQSACVLQVRTIQSFHVESRGWYDIGYNFMVGGDGSAYYGRGWDYVGAHTKGYNTISMCIAFIGTFNNSPPPKQQIDACKKLIRLGVLLGKISKDYKLLAHRQLMSSLSPGDKLFDLMQDWPHFVTNVSSVLDIFEGQGL